MAAHIDLLQFHEVIRLDDPDRIFAPGGALEAFLHAKEQGKVRIPIYSGQGFRREAGHHSDLKSAVVPR